MELSIEFLSFVTEKESFWKSGNFKFVVSKIQSNGQVEVFELDFSQICKLMINDLTIAIRFQVYNSENVLEGSISFESEFLNEILRTTKISQKVTLFDDESDDCFDGDIGIDDNEYPLIEFTVTNIILTEMTDKESVDYSMKMPPKIQDSENNRLDEDYSNLQKEANPKMTENAYYHDVQKEKPEEDSDESEDDDSLLDQSSLKEASSEESGVKINKDSIKLKESEDPMIFSEIPNRESELIEKKSDSKEKKRFYSCYPSKSTSSQMKGEKVNIGKSSDSNVQVDFEKKKENVNSYIQSISSLQISSYLQDEVRAFINSSKSEENSLIIYLKNSLEKEKKANKILEAKIKDEENYKHQYHSLLNSYNKLIDNYDMEFHTRQNDDSFVNPLATEIKEIHKKYSEAITNNKELLVALNQSVDNHNKDVKILNKELSAKIQENEKLKVTLKDIHQDFKQTQSQLKTLSSLFDELENEKIKWREEKVNLIDKHSKEMMNLTECLNETNLDLGLKNNEIQRLNFIVQELEEKIAVSENLGYISSDNESSQEKRETKKLDHLKKVLKEKSKENLQFEIKYLNEQISDLKNMGMANYEYDVICTFENLIDHNIVKTKKCEIYKEAFYELLSLFPNANESHMMKKNDEIDKKVHEVLKGIDLPVKLVRESEGRYSLGHRKIHLKIDDSNNLIISSLQNLSVSFI